MKVNRYDICIYKPVPPLAYKGNVPTVSAVTDHHHSTHLVDHVVC